MWKEAFIMQKKYEIKYVKFQNQEWNYLKIENKDKITIYINERKKVINR